MCRSVKSVFNFDQSARYSARRCQSPNSMDFSDAFKLSPALSFHKSLSIEQSKVVLFNSVASIEGGYGGTPATARPMLSDVRRLTLGERLTQITMTGWQTPSDRSDAFHFHEQSFIFFVLNALPEKAAHSQESLNRCSAFPSPSTS